MREIEAFTENLSLLDPTKDTVAWNLNRGLQELAERLAKMQDEICHIRDVLETAPLR